MLLKPLRLKYLPTRSSAGKELFFFFAFKSASTEKIFKNMFPNKPLILESHFTEHQNVRALYRHMLY